MTSLSGASTIGPRPTIAAALSAAAGMIHVAAATTHFGDSPQLGYGFLAVAVLQVLLGGALLRWTPPAPVLVAGVTIHLAAIVAWAASRTVGLPIGHAGPEPVGAADVSTVVLEVLVIGLLAWRTRDRRVRRPGRPATVAAMAMTGVLATGGIAFALGDLGSGHGHGTGGSDHGSTEHPGEVHHTQQPSAVARTDHDQRPPAPALAPPATPGPPHVPTAAPHEDGHSHAAGEEHG